jgi:hypothetical protein
MRWKAAGRRICSGLTKGAVARWSRRVSDRKQLLPHRPLTATRSRQPEASAPGPFVVHLML